MFCYNFQQKFIDMRIYNNKDQLLNFIKEDDVRERDITIFLPSHDVRNIISQVYDLNQIHSIYVYYSSINEAQNLKDWWFSNNYFKIRQIFCHDQLISKLCIVYLNYCRSNNLPSEEAVRYNELYQKYLNDIKFQLIQE
ncbi:unnamed protein product, partial [Didymodactylos carnosus]